MSDENPPADETTELPASEPVSTALAATRRPRQVIAAGAVGLLVAGGLAGFGIGRSTAGDDRPRFERAGQFGPGHHGFGRDGRQRPPGNFDGNGQRGPGFGPGQLPNGPAAGQPGGQPPQPSPSPSTKPS